MTSTPSNSSTLRKLMEPGIILSCYAGMNHPERANYFRNLVERLLQRCHDIADKDITEDSSDDVVKPFGEFLDEADEIIGNDPNIQESEIVRRIKAARVEKLIDDTRQAVMKAHGEYRAAKSQTP